MSDSQSNDNNRESVSVECRLIVGDAIKELNKLANEFIDLFITSPPYHVGKNYGDDKLDFENMNDSGYRQAIEKYANLAFKKGKKYVCTIVGPDSRILQDALIKAAFHSNLQIIKLKQKEFEQRDGYTHTLVIACKRKPEIDVRERLGLKADEIWNLTKYYRHPLKEIHPATFTPEIPRKLIQIFCLPGDWVCDPFNGIGNTTDESRKLHCNSIGIDLYDWQKRYEDFKAGKAEEFKKYEPTQAEIKITTKWVQRAWKLIQAGKFLQEVEKCGKQVNPLICPRFYSELQLSQATLKIKGPLDIKGSIVYTRRNILLLADSELGKNSALESYFNNFCNIKKNATEARRSDSYFAYLIQMSTIAKLRGSVASGRLIGPIAQKADIAHNMELESVTSHDNYGRGLIEFLKVAGEEGEVTIPIAAIGGLENIDEQLSDLRKRGFEIEYDRDISNITFKVHFIEVLGSKPDIDASAYPPDFINRFVPILISTTEKQKRDYIAGKLRSSEEADVEAIRAACCMFQMTEFRKTSPPSDKIIDECVEIALTEIEQICGDASLPFKAFIGMRVRRDILLTLMAHAVIYQLARYSHDQLVKSIKKERLLLPDIRYDQSDVDYVKAWAKQYAFNRVHTLNIFREAQEKEKEAHRDENSSSRESFALEQIKKADGKMITGDLLLAIASKFVMSERNAERTLKKLSQSGKIRRVKVGKSTWFVELVEGKAP